MASYLLKEDGGYLLTEAGDRILLEPDDGFVPPPDTATHSGGRPKARRPVETQLDPRPVYQVHRVTGHADLGGLVAHAQLVVSWSEDGDETDLLNLLP